MIADLTPHRWRRAGGLVFGALLVAHVNRNGDTERPFGSAFWHNGSRATWYVKVEHELGGTMALGIGRTALYGEIAAGRLRSVKVGRRRLVPTTAIADYIEAAGPVSETTGAGPEAERGRARPTIAG